MVFSNKRMVPSTGFEPVTSSLPMTRSTAGAMTALFLINNLNMFSIMTSFLLLCKH
jgi:hypothetical protein